MAGGYGDFTENTWRFILTDYDDEGIIPKHYYSGTYATFIENYRSGESKVDCYITSPFVATLTGYGNYNTSNPYEICAKWLNWSIERELSDISRLPGDKCPDGFYTVPYDISCGEGFVDDTDIPSCNDDTSGTFCMVPGTVPCTSGVTQLRTSTGLSFSLWAEKYTTPAICVMYNNTICYINLVQGSAANSINVNYNGTIYHTVD